MMRTGLVLAEVQLVIGVLLVIIGSVLIHRKADSGVKLLTTWGAFWVLDRVWEMYFSLAHGANLSTSPQWVQALTWLFPLVGQILVLFTALYALWRFWRASAGNRG